MATFTKKLIRDEVPPMAASASVEAYLPMTIMSAALNSSWNTPESMSGTEKRRSLGNNAPVFMSISYFFPPVYDISNPTRPIT